ncbi:MAG TPA: M3 family metallopeptidase, partial [Alphaproteobacteria bacterium]|nr:M3 family metallopeptidase [Alphaproteobacteria bacterium]
MSDVPTPVAETASIFAEMLVFEELLKTEKDPAVRKKLLVDRLENMLGNGLQQLAYYDFEKRVHDARREGELDAEAISDIWVETQREYYGPSVETDDYDRYYWMTVPHFFDTPFYVYSYAFAQQVVSGLYRSYKAAEAEGADARAEFIENYIGLLESGLTKNLYEMFQPFDLDPESREFWENGLSLAAQYLDELTALDTAAPAARPKGAKAPRAGKK